MGGSGTEVKHNTESAEYLQSQRSGRSNSRKVARSWHYHRQATGCYVPVMRVLRCSIGVLTDQHKSEAAGRSRDTDKLDECSWRTREGFLYHYDTYVVNEGG